MPENRLSVGTHYRQRGRELTIDGYLPDGSLRVKDMVTNEFSSRSEGELLDALFDRELEIIGDNQNLPYLEKKLEKSRASDLTLLENEKDKARKQEAYRRKSYVQGVIGRNITTFTSRTLTPIIKAVSKTLNDLDPPHWRTLIRWYKDYIASGKDERSLVPAWNRRGNYERKCSGVRLKEFKERDKEKAEVVAKLVAKAVQIKYLRHPPPTVVSVRKWLEALILRYNRHRCEEDQLPVPHVNSFHHYISTLDQYEVDAARHGKSYADAKWRDHKQGPRPTRVLERTQFDHTRIDMFVVDTETRLPLGRPWFTSIIDVYSKAILGIYIGFIRPSYESAMYCLLHAIRPKTYVKNVYPEIQNTWDAYGIPEQITVDNAKEFYSDSFKDACFQLGIDIHYAPRQAAWYKGTMERFYGTVNTELLHEMPGTTFSNIFQKGDYDPKKHALISLDALIKMTHAYIIDIYHQKVHRGVSDIPARRWRESIKEWPPNLPARKEDLEVLLGHVEERSVDGAGIEFHYLYYKSEELGLIRRQLKPGEKAIIKVNLNDISFIYVYDKRNDKYLPVPAVDQEYTKGLTLWQHIVVSNYRRKFPYLLEDRDGLSRAKLLLQQIVEREMQSNKLLSGSEKMARYMNWGMPNYAELIMTDEGDDKDVSMSRNELEECETESERPIASHLAGISNPTKVMSNGKSTQEDKGGNSFGIEFAELYDPNGSSAVISTSGPEKRKSSNHKKKKSTEAGEGAKLGSKKHGRTDAGANHQHPVSPDDDDEGDWGADYDLPV
jgi:putative transposase